MSKRSRHKAEQKRKRKPPKAIYRNYPTIFCTGEDICIAISKRHVKLKGDRFGRKKASDIVSDKHWKRDCCEFRGTEYIFDMGNYKDGDEVKCPKCGEPVDFRLFPSSVIPRFVQVKEDNNDQAEADELPDT